jgi:hypothetical protein
MTEPEKFDDAADASHRREPMGELFMIALQQVVSARQLAVQLATRVMQMLHDATMAVVKNIRDGGAPPTDPPPKTGEDETDEDP